MPTLSSIQWVITGVVFLVLLVVGVVGFVIAGNRAEQIKTLGVQLQAQDQQTINAVNLANENAAQAAQLEKALTLQQEVLNQKTAMNIQLSSDVAKLQIEVSHAQAATCYPPAIVNMVVGLHSLQSHRPDGDKNTGAGGQGAKGAAPATATTPSAADQAVAKWIADLYQHDLLCVSNLAAISKLQGE